MAGLGQALSEGRTSSVLVTRAHLSRIERLDPPAGFESNGLWFRDHNGVPVEIRVAEKSSPNAKSVFSAPSGPPGVPGTIARSKAPITHPRRLAHILLFTVDVPRATEFYTKVLGLRLSDSSEGNIAFLQKPFTPATLTQQVREVLARIVAGLVNPYRK